MMNSFVHCAVFLLCLVFVNAQNDDPVCKVKADIGLIMDKSISLFNHYADEKKFAKALAAAFGIDLRNGARISVITFSTTAKLDIKFNEYDNLLDFNVGIDDLPIYGSQTRIDRALRLAQSEMFTLRNGMRPDTPKVLVLMTDGKQWKVPGYEDPALVVKDLRRAGIQVLLVGMGPDSMNMNDLRYIADEDSNAFRASEYPQLLSDGFIKAVRDKTCQTVNPAPAPTKPPADVCPDYDADYNSGKDIALVLDVADWINCLRNCKANVACGSFTYVPKTKCCYLKSAKTSRSVKVGLISGSRNCPDNTPSI